MQAMNTQVDGGALTSLDDFLLYLLTHLSHYLLDAGRVDAAVSYQLVQSQAGNLTTHRIEGRKYDGLWSVIHDDFYACGSLQGTDVTALTTYDTTLDLVRVDVEHSDRVLYGRLAGHTLNALDHDALSLLGGIQLGIIHDFVDVSLSLRLSLLFQ